MKKTRNPLGSICCIMLLVASAQAETGEAGAGKAENQGEKITEMQRACRDLEVIVEARRKELAQLCRAHNVIYRPGGVDDGSDAWVKRANHLAKRLAEVESEKILADSRYKTLMELAGDELLVFAVNGDVPDNGIKALHAMCLQARLDLSAMMTNDGTENSPELQRQKRKVEALREQLEDSVHHLRAALRVEQSILAEQAENLRAEMIKSQDEAVSRGLDLMNLDDARREYEAASARLARHKEELAKSRMPK